MRKANRTARDSMVDDDNKVIFYLPQKDHRHILRLVTHVHPKQNNFAWFTHRRTRQHQQHQQQQQKEETFQQYRFDCAHIYALRSVLLAVLCAVCACIQLLHKNKASKQQQQQSNNMHIFKQEMQLDVLLSSLYSTTLCSLLVLHLKQVRTFLS